MNAYMVRPIKSKSRRSLPTQGKEHKLKWGKQMTHSLVKTVSYRILSIRVSIRTC